MDRDNQLIEQSSKSYSKVISMLEHEFGIPGPPAFSTGARIEQVREMIRRLLRLTAQRAVHEATFRVFQWLTSTAAQADLDYHWPRFEVHIHTGEAGDVKVGPFTTARVAGSEIDY